MFDIIVKGQLDNTIRNDILEMTSHIISQEHLHLSYPLDEDAIHFMIYDRSRLVSVAALLPISNHIYECIGFTMRERRLEGLFLSIWDRILIWFIDNHPDDIDTKIIFITDDSHADISYIPRYLGSPMEVSKEYMMHIDLIDYIPAYINSQKISANRRKCKIRKYNNKYHIYISSHMIGSFGLDISKDSDDCFLYDYKILPRLRGLHLGTIIFPHILNYAKYIGCSKLSLHVSSDNIAAYKIYKNAGLLTSISLSYHTFVL